MLDIKYVKKKNTQATSRAILFHLENKEVYDVLSEISYTTNDNNFKELINKFEKQLLLAITDPNKFTESLYKFFKDNERFIKKNKLYKDLFEFIFFVRNKLNLQNTDKNIYSAYLSLLMEQAAYLRPLNKMICGIKTDGSIIERPEVYKQFEYASLEFEILSKKNKLTFNNDGFKEFKKLLNKYGYSYIKTSEDFLLESCNETLVSNMFFDLIPLIDENNEDIIPLPFYRGATGFNLIIPDFNSTDKYKELLTERICMLPTGGVIGKLKNLGDLKEILFKEVYKYDNFYMLYKIKMEDNTYISGYYDLSNQLFHSCWKETIQEQGKYLHEKLENIVLGLYANLTADTYKLDFAFSIVDDVEFVEYTYNTQVKNNDGKVQFRKFDKNNLDKTIKQINPFIRKLPEGAKASQEAIDNAKRFGFRLRDGETFVKPFEKNINIHKK